MRLLPSTGSALAWSEDALRHAGAHDRGRLAGYPGEIREDLVFEMAWNAPS